MKIAYVHPDAEGREEEVRLGLYPKNQLWGADLLQEAGHELLLVKTKAPSPMVRLGHWLNKLTGRRLGDFHIELQVLAAFRHVDLVYAPSGHFLLLPLLRRWGLFRPKLVTWFFSLPESKAWWNPRNLRFSRYVLNGFDGLLCLTKKASEDFQGRTDGLLIESFPWYADPEIFKPDPEGCKGEYFLSVGKTCRDYPTLLKACAQVDAQFRIIAPKEVAKEVPISPNVEFIEASSDPPDKALPYPELRNWYANAIAVLIPLTGDPDDTSGYTSLLEAIAMYKPVIMTKSGCLDVDVEALEVGKCIPPGDVDAWVSALQGFHAGTLTDWIFEQANSGISREQFGEQLQNFLAIV
jgi:glycosyltransferase involved in cell wall biosynthesis